MKITDVMKEIGSVLEGIPDLQVFPHPSDSITPPTAEVLFPDIDYDQAFQRGLSQMQGAIVVSVGRILDQAAFEALARYADPADTPHSIHAALYNHTFPENKWTTCSYALATNGFGVDHVVNEISYVAYRFPLDIAGSGK